MLRGCFVLLSIISWMSLVLTAVFEGVMSVEAGVLGLIMGIFVFAIGGRRIMQLIIPIFGLMLLLHTLSKGSRAAFLASAQTVSVLGIICVGFFIMFSGLRRSRI